LGDYTLITAPALYCQPTAILRVTLTWNANGSGVYNNHPVGVCYIAGSAQRCAIFNQDHAAVTPGASLNVTGS
jgi:hypothetical protein